MGKNAGVEFYGEAGGKCGKCGMKAKKGCCTDEHKFYKLSDSHKNVSNDIAFEQPVAALVPTGIPIDFTAPATATCKGALRNNSPPDYTGPSARIFYCIFRI